VNRSQTNKELANVLSHLFGLILSIVSVPVLMNIVTDTGELSWIIACAIYSTSIIMIFTSSVLFHSAYEPYLRHKLRILDHFCIYVGIAGSYTPFILIFFPSLKGYILLGIVWACVLLGLFFKIFFVHKFKMASTIAYVVMGSLVLLFGKDLALLPEETFKWLAIGGLMFIIGTAFYIKDEIFYNHLIWHLFVLAGFICHFIALVQGISTLSP